MDAGYFAGFLVKFVERLSVLHFRFLLSMNDLMEDIAINFNRLIAKNFVIVHIFQNLAYLFGFVLLVSLVE